MNAGVSSFIILIFIVVFIAAFRKSRFSFSDKSVSDDEADTDYTLEVIAKQLDKINNVMNRINDIEELITDVEICDPERYMKNITFNWTNEENGYRSHYDFFLTGDNLNTEMILKMAYAERKELRSLLIQEIDKLSERSTKNVRKTMT